jgi:hypothetical protein
MGLDASTRIVGFFVSAMGVALIFDGVIEALESHGVTICIESVSRRMSAYDPKRTFHLHCRSNLASGHLPVLV